MASLTAERGEGLRLAKQYSWSRQPNGNFTVFDVEIFGEVPAGEKEGLSEPIDREWMDRAVQKFRFLASSEGKYPGVHLDHHPSNRDDVNKPNVGYLDNLQVKDTDRGPKIFADLVEIDPETFQQIRELRIPGRSVELLPPFDGISSLALLRSRDPHFDDPILALEPEPRVQFSCDWEVRRTPIVLGGDLALRFQAQCKKERKPIGGKKMPCKGKEAYQHPLKAVPGTQKTMGGTREIESFSCSSQNFVNGGTREMSEAIERAADWIRRGKSDSVILDSLEHHFPHFYEEELYYALRRAKHDYEKEKEKKETGMFNKEEGMADWERQKGMAISRARAELEAGTPEEQILGILRSSYPHLDDKDIQHALERARESGYQRYQDGGDQNMLKEIHTMLQKFMEEKSSSDTEPIASTMQRGGGGVQFAAEIRALKSQVSDLVNQNQAAQRAIQDSADEQRLRSEIAQIARAGHDIDQAVTFARANKYRRAGGMQAASLFLEEVISLSRPPADHPAVTFARGSRPPGAPAWIDEYKDADPETQKIVQQAYDDWHDTIEELGEKSHIFQRHNGDVASFVREAVGNRLVFQKIRKA